MSWTGFVKPPPPTVHLCAFQTNCKIPGAQAASYICGYCRNLSLFKLNQKAGNDQTLKALVQQWYKERLDHAKRLASNKDPTKKQPTRWLCASSDPEFAQENWRFQFEPHRELECLEVDKKGLLCSRCREDIGTPQPAWYLTEFDRDWRFMFPCIFHDPRYDDPKKDPEYWKTKYSPSPEDVKYHGECQRTKKKAQMCPTCYARLTATKSAWRYFRSADGTLRPGKRAEA